jgi:hypothetical protein
MDSHKEQFSKKKKPITEIKSAALHKDRPQKTNDNYRT